MALISNSALEEKTLSSREAEDDGTAKPPHSIYRNISNNVEPTRTKKKISRNIKGSGSIRKHQPQSARISARLKMQRPLGRMRRAAEEAALMYSAYDMSWLGIHLFPPVSRRIDSYQHIPLSRSRCHRDSNDNQSNGDRLIFYFLLLFKLEKKEKKRKTLS